MSRTNGLFSIRMGYSFTTLARKNNTNTEATSSLRARRPRPRRRANSPPCRNVSNTNFVSSITASPLLLCSPRLLPMPRIRGWGAASSSPPAAAPALSATLELEGRCLQRPGGSDRFKNWPDPRPHMRVMIRSLCSRGSERDSFYH